MKLNKILIQNYKSIRKLEFEFNSYGKGPNKSYTNFLLGINESGKSNLLNAIAALNGGFVESYEEACFKGAQEDGEDVLIDGSFEVINQIPFEKLIKELDFLPDSLSSIVKIKSIDREYILSADGSVSEAFAIYINELKPKTYQVNSANNIIIIDKKLEDDYKFLDTKKLKSIIFKNISEHLVTFFSEITLWRPDSAHLITEQISLKAFSQNPNISIPLKNIFHIYGKIENTDITKTITSALKSPEKKAELQDTLSEKVTKHVNRIWKEHKINFKFTIDGDLLNTVIEDKQIKYRYFNMKQRSEGFKQFTSLILSLSAKNTGNLLANNVILIDEPETHLHPSGIQYMRKELLRIGKKNQVLVSTHSNFMIDTSTMERHWIMEKETESNMFQVDEYKSLHDEEVVSRAFGVEIMKELLPKNILIVEGKCDKIVLEMLLKHFGEKISYSIKNAGGCSKVYSVASILAAEQFRPIVFLDSDDEGLKAKKDILKNLKDYYNTNSVRTINDLGYSRTAKASIEDLYPRLMVKNLVNDKHAIDIDEYADKPIIEAIKILDESFKNKEKQTKLKTELSLQFLNDYDNKDLLEKDAPDMVSLGKKLIELLDT